MLKLSRSQQIMTLGNIRRPNQLIMTQQILI